MNLVGGSCNQVIRSDEEESMSALQCDRIHYSSAVEPCGSDPHLVCSVWMNPLWKISNEVTD